MSVKPRPRAGRQSQRADSTATAPSVLKQFDCTSVIYDFEIPIDSFKAKTFFENTGLGEGDNWSAVLPSDNRHSRYHVHFKGIVESKRVELTIEYWDGPIKRTKAHPEPSSEAIMQWIGSFVRDPSARAVVTARFQKPGDTWRSRFNLPFKVTMGEAEVVIDGVSLVLPKNPFRAINGWLTRVEQSLFITVDFVRPVHFARFSLGEDVASFNEAVKIFVEHLA